METTIVDEVAAVLAGETWGASYRVVPSVLVEMALVLPTHPDMMLWPPAGALERAGWRVSAGRLAGQAVLLVDRAPLGDKEGG